MRVREIDAPNASEGLLVALQELEERATAELTPAEPRRPAEEALAYYRHVPRDQARPRWIAEEDGELVGLAALYVHAPTHVYGQIAVAPDRRRRGIGTALLDQLVAAAHERGISSFYGHYVSAAGAAFAAKAGAVDDQRDVRSLLDLKGADLPAPRIPAGYALRSWRGRAPDELVESFARARAALDDAPLPAGQGGTTWTVEVVRDLEQIAERRGREIRVTAALDKGGTVVSFTELRLSPPPARLVHTDDTGTVAAARGRGLATAVKLESLRRLRAARPDVELVVTMNAEHNAAMRHVNTRIGFVPSSTLTTSVLTL